MITNFKFQIIPDRNLYPGLPIIDLFVKKELKWLFVKEVFTWSCLPGYTRENAGAVSVHDFTTSGENSYSFFICSKSKAGVDPGNTCYGILHHIPKEFTIGASNFGTFSYSGSKSKKLLNSMKEKNELVLFVEWKLIDVY